MGTTTGNIQGDTKGSDPKSQALNPQPHCILQGLLGGMLGVKTIAHIHP